MFEQTISKSTRNETKWALKIFSEWQFQRENKDPTKEKCSFPFEPEKVQSLETNITDMSAKSLNLWIQILYKISCSLVFFI